MTFYVGESSFRKSQSTTRSLVRHDLGVSSDTETSTFEGVDRVMEMVTAVRMSVENQTAVFGTNDQPSIVRFSGHVNVLSLSGRNMITRYVKEVKLKIHQ